MVRSTRATRIRRRGAGPGPAEFAALLDVPPDRARALVCAAVRETFESRRLLAGASHDDLISDSAVLAADRHALLAGNASLAEVLGRRGLALRSDLLTPWARWITPEASPRRFDTWFFAAALPPGQEGHGGAGGFLTRTPGSPSRAPGCGPRRRWRWPGRARCTSTLLPPTAVTLVELGGHLDVPAILARRQVITPRLPKVIVEDGRVRLALPPSGPQVGRERETR